MAYKRHGAFPVIGGGGTSPRPKSVSLKEAVERLNTKKRGKGKLTPAATRDKIKESRAVAFPTAANGKGLVSPWVEQYYDGAEGYYSMTSSDGLFVFEYPTQTTYIDADGTGVSFIVKHLDPDEPAPQP